MTRLLLRPAFLAARASWWLTRPRHAGALVAIRIAGQLLLVRQSYRAELTLPGGGLRRSETARLGASRELREELGLAVAPEALRLVYEETGLWDWRRDHVTFFELVLPSLPALTLDRREVVAAMLVDPGTIGAVTALTGPTRAYLRHVRVRGAGAGAA